MGQVCGRCVPVLKRTVSRGFVMGRRREVWLCLACLLFVASCAAPSLAQDKPAKDKPAAGKDDKEFFKGPLAVRCERDSAIYKAGENATFLIYSDTGGTASYRFSDDGHKTIKEG